MTRTKQILVGLVLAGAVVAPHWTLAAGPAPVALGETAHFTILAGAAITSTGGGIINGDVGASPIAGSAIGLTAAQVNGIIYAVDASGPAGSVVDPALLATAKGDLTTAYNDAAGRTPVPTGEFLNPGGGNIGGLNLVPGLYKFTGTAVITGSDVTLTGGPDDVWIFQIAAELQVGSGLHVILAGGARARNIFWQVGTSAVLGTFSVFKGTIMADQAITLNTSSTMEGRALARIAGVTFNGDSIGPTTPWTDATDLGGGWKWLDWFGYFNTNSDPWIYHQEHGWLYSTGADTSSIFFWDGAISSFWWTSASVYPFVYRFSDSSWLWYQEGSVGPRWFYNVTAGNWESW